MTAVLEEDEEKQSRKKNDQGESAPSGNAPRTVLPHPHGN
jgi:hypothetical protein